MGILEAGAAMLLLVTAQAPAQTQRQAPARSAPARPVPQAQARSQGPVIPTRLTTKTFLDLCSGGDKNICIAYALGAADAYVTALSAAGRPQVFCFPAGTTNQAIADSSVQYLRARPKEAGNNAAMSLLSAFAAIYPCPR